MQNTPRKFGDVFVKKQAILDNRNRDLRKPQNCLFAKGLVYDLGQKVKFQKVTPVTPVTPFNPL